MTNKNKISWNLGAEAYSKKFHKDEIIKGILKNPKQVFHPTTWEQIKRYVPEFSGKKICVPSSGDNHAVFAFAQLGAQVTSCDISEKQLENAYSVAKKYNLDNSIEFVCQDTMELDKIEDNTYDFVFTSNGVHVWINDLLAMYKNIYRVIKPNGVYIMHEIHPFQRPFNDDAHIIKPYDKIGPFEDEQEITYHWRLMDIFNAITTSGLNIEHTEEMFCEKDYEEPFWLSLDDILKGITATKEEVDRMHDWKINPMAAIPNWLNVVAIKR